MLSKSFWLKEVRWGLPAELVGVAVDIRDASISEWRLRGSLSKPLPSASPAWASFLGATSGCSRRRPSETAKGPSGPREPSARCTGQIGAVKQEGSGALAPGMLGHRGSAGSSQSSGGRLHVLESLIEDRYRLPSVQVGVVLLFLAACVFVKVRRCGCLRFLVYQRQSES